MTLDPESLIYGFDLPLQGKSPAQPVELQDLKSAPASGHWRWLHLEKSSPKVADWLQHESDLDPLVIQALLEHDSRPRLQTYADGMLLILRGANLNHGERPEDMIALRLWVTADRITSLRLRKVFAVQAVADDIASGKLPDGPGGFIASLVDGLTDRLAASAMDLQDRTDALEIESLDTISPELRRSVTDLRREIVAFLRYLSPQREVLAKLKSMRSPMFHDDAQQAIGESHESMARIVDQLTALRERASILHETLEGEAAIQMNRTMYILSILTAIFLPLSFLTGLLGINVGGIPGAQDSSAFFVVCIGMIVAIILQVWIFRKLGWFRND